MNQTLVSLAVAMMVPAVAVIFVVVEERKRVVPEEPTIAEIVLVIPALTNLLVPVVTRRRWFWLRLKGRRPKSNS
jgi:hypothetical protein